MDYKIVLGVIATLMALYSYIPYFRNIFKRKTKPHALTWLVWALLTAIAFAGQLSENAGPGAWVTGFTALVSFIIFFISLKLGEKNIVPIDWLSLFGALIAIFFWYITNNPLTSVILVTIIDALGFFPTFRKSFSKPFEETAQTYFLSGLKFVIAIIALENFNLITWLYPASLVFANWAFVVMVLILRNKSNPKHNK